MKCRKEGSKARRQGRKGRKEEGKERKREGFDLLYDTDMIIRVQIIIIISDR